MEALQQQLYPVKAQFYVGNFQSAINQANSVTLKSSSPGAADANIVKSVFLYRSYFAQKKYSLLMADLSPTLDPSRPETAIIRALAVFATAQSREQKNGAVESAQKAMESMIASLTDDPFRRIPLAAVLLAELFALDGQLEEAMKAVASYRNTDLECMATMTWLLLKVNRVDLAEKQVEQMRSIMEDAIPTQIAEAWLYLAQAYYIYQELMETNGVTSKLLNGQAACQMHMGKFDEAEKTLLDALNKSNDDPDTLANLTVCARHLKKPTEIADRYFIHPLVVETDLKMALFDRSKVTMG